ncbi:50S ribosomal protein L13 [Candidatus Babeliales bacterium]|nr:50S ribosomal protein L13 [Candidatus Babeliales bacterium]
MNKSFFLRKEDRKPNWRVMDASGMILGRLATRVATILIGKDKPEYTPHTDTGDYVIITNCEKIMLSGNKFEDKIYRFFSGWRGGLKEKSAKEVFKKDPTLLIKYAVKRMLPKSRLGRQMFKKLKVYSGSEHPHKAQVSSFEGEPKK